jgi:4-amino-4-deoxy-L-arabinose transferase-like glycosyltransferase
MEIKLLFTRFIEQLRKYSHQVIFAIILLFAVMLRLYDFGTIPVSIHQDEAIMAYDAYADLFYGMDINGDHNPVYGVSWGSGQSMGYNYVLRPFIKIFGLNIVTVRLPMLIFGIISLFFFYLLLSRLFGSNVGLLGFFLLAFNPWHIMLSRWALDCNFAPLIFLPAVYFAVISREKPAFFILSMFLFGFSCYGYGTVLMLCIVFIPLMIWHVFRHKVVPVKYAISGFLTFGLVSGPLMIWSFINAFNFPAFKLFELSITRMTVMRSSSTVSFNFSEHFTHFLRFLLTGHDGWIGNAISEYGTLYPFMLPFILFGTYVLFIKHKGEASEIKFWLISSVLLALVVHLMVHRINMIFFPLICLATLGVAEIHRFAKFVVPIFASLVIIMTIGFANIYFKEFNGRSQWAYYNKFDKAIEYAIQNSQPNATIYFGNVPYSLVLYVAKIPPQQFLSTVVWVNPRVEFRHPIRFDRFATGVPHSLNSGDVGVFTKNEVNNNMRSNASRITEFGNYLVIEN